MDRYSSKKIPRPLACTAIALLISAGSLSQAATLSSDSLPNGFDGTVYPISGTDYPSIGMTTYLAQENTLGIGYLLQYHLRSSSVTSSNDNGATTDESSGEISRDLWLFAPRQFSLNGDDSLSHTVQGYNVPHSYSKTTTEFQFTDSALLNGSGFSYLGYDAPPHLIMTPPEAVTMQVMGQDIDCVAVGCESAYRLNLLYLDYQMSGNNAVLSFNTSAPANRPLLQYANGYEEYSRSSSYYLAEVPLPAGIWLFTGSLLTLGAASRSSSKSR